MRLLDPQLPGPLSPTEAGGDPAAGEGVQDGTQETSAGDMLADIVLDFPGGTAAAEGTEKEGEPADEAETEGEPGKGKNKPKAEGGEEPEEGADEEGETAVLRDMRAKIRRQDKEIKKLRAEMGGDKEKGGDKKERLSRQQLLGLLKEHEGNPEVLLNIMEYMRDMGTEDTKEAAESAARRTQVLAKTDDYCGKIHKDYGDDDSELMSMIASNYLEQYELSDHPYARPIGFALWILDNLPGIIQRHAKSGAAAEQARRQKVIGTTLPSGKKKVAAGDGKKTVVSLTPAQKKVAKELGVNEVTYAQMLKVS